MRSPRLVAMDYLARREHTRVELERKLLQKEFDAEEVRRVLDKLHEDNLQSDHRFAEHFASQRIRTGHGPLKIKMELQAHGVCEEMIEELFQALTVDWQELAQSVFERKYGENSLSLDIQEKAKRQRFLQQRGFTFEQIRKVLSCNIFV